MAAQLDAFVEPLLAAGYRVVSFDAPGPGASTESFAGRGRATLLEFSESLSSAVDRFGDAHAVIAHSFGGRRPSYRSSMDFQWEDWPWWRR